MKKSKIIDSFVAYKIGIIRTDKIGDMILTLPMARFLKEINPHNHITIFARKYVEPVLDSNPFIDRVLLVEDISELKDNLEFFDFDIIFFPRPKLDEALAVYKSEVKHRVGTAYRLYSILFNHRLKLHRKTAEFHEAEYNNKLIECLFGKYDRPQLTRPNIDSKAEGYINNLLKKLNITDKFIIVHPGSGGSARDWSIEKFAELSKMLNNNTDYKIVLTGNESEKLKTDIIYNYDNRCVNLAGELDLYQMIALISKSGLLIANSTGIIHIATALEVPVVGFYPNTPSLSSKRWGPFTENKLLFSPNYINEADKDSMELITTDEVYKGIIEFTQRQFSS